MLSSSGDGGSLNSYSNERPPPTGGSGGGGGGGGSMDIEYASDPASGGFFHADYKKYEPKTLIILKKIFYFFSSTDTMT